MTADADEPTRFCRTTVSEVTVTTSGLLTFRGPELRVAEGSKWIDVCHLDTREGQRDEFGITAATCRSLLVQLQMALTTGKRILVRTSEPVMCKALESRPPIDSIRLLK